MRDLYEVITEMLKVVPENSGLYNALLSHRSSAEFSAPEVMDDWWWETADSLAYHIGEVTEPWHKEVAAIWKGK